MLRKLAHLPVVGPVVGIVHFFHRFGTAALPVLKDLLSTWGQTSQFRRIPEPDIVQGTVLILAMGDINPFALKMYGFKTASLRHKGWRGVGLLGVRAHWITKAYLKAFGVKNFVYLDSYQICPQDQFNIERAIESFLQDCDTVQQIKHWEFEGAWIGPQMLATLSRSNFAGAPDPKEPATRERFREELGFLLPHVVRAQKMAAELNAELAFVVEANYSFYGALVDAIIGHDGEVIQITQPWKDDGLMLKRLTPKTRRQHPSSLEPESFSAILETPWDQRKEGQLWTEFEGRYQGKWFLQNRNQPQVTFQDKEAIYKRFHFAPDKKLVVVFSHILWDANLFYGKDLFEDYADWFIQTVRAACKNDRVNWLIKMHPANLWKRAWEQVETEYAEVSLIREKIGELPSHVQLLKPDTNISTFSIFQATDVGITVRGTTGMELPCFGKPVLTAGTGRYSGMGFTEEFATKEDYLAQLDAIENLEPLSQERTELAKRHAQTIFCHRHWTMESMKVEFNYPKSGGHPLATNLRFAEEAWPTDSLPADIDRFATWADKGESPDYLEYLEAEK